MNFKTILLLAGVFMFCIPKLKAQEKESIVFIPIKKANGDIIALLYDMESPHFQDPKAPRFLLYDQKRKFALGIGGFVRMTASYDFNGISDDKDFVPYDIPVPNTPAKRNQFQMDAATSRIFLELVGSNRLLGDFNVYIESDFRGQSNNLRLRQAYMSFRGFLFGQSWSTYSDVASVPPTIDNAGPNSNSSERNIQIRYTYEMNNHWQTAIALEAPKLSATYGQYNQSIPQRVPDIPLYIQYAWGNKSHIRATGLLRTLSYRNENNDENKNLLAWGTQLSGVYNVCPKVSLYYQGMYGKGIARYITDLNGVGLDMVPRKDDDGRMQVLPTFAFLGGLRYNFNDSWFASASYSQVRLYRENGYYQPDGYKYAQYIVGNLFWELTHDCRFGLEYLYGRRVNMDSKTGHANRIQLMAQYNF